MTDGTTCANGRCFQTKKAPLPGPCLVHMVLSVECPRPRCASPRALRCSAPRAPRRETLVRFLASAPVGFESHRAGAALRKRPRCRGLVRAHGALCGIRTRDLSLRRRTLYPAELRELARDSIRHSAPSSKSAWFVWVGFSSVSTRFGWPGRSLTPYNEHSHAPARAPHRLEPS